MNVAIIGTGNVGGALGSSLTRAGHSVTFYSRNQQKATDLAAANSATTADTPAQAVEGADVIILAVPYASAAEVVREIGDAASGKVVIDTTNPLKADYTGVQTDSGASAAEEIAQHIGRDVRVVKAFNTVFAGIQADPSATSQTPDLLFATDDEQARATVAELAESIGFRPVWVGPLAAARELESLAWLNIRLQLINGGSWNTAIKLVDAPENALLAA